MGLFDINDEKLQALYHRALVEANYGFVNPRKYPYLDRAIMQYARENGCSYDQALILAKTGKKMFQEALSTSYYVMSDIHGCYDDMIKMLEQIAFTDEDTLILAGDYIDRGSQSFEMVNYSDLQKSELPASTTTALATMIRNSMSYTMSTGV